MRPFYNYFQIVWAISQITYAQQCSQPRPEVTAIPPPPSASDLVNFVRPNISVACSSLTSNATILGDSYMLQGYKFSRVSLPGTILGPAEESVCFNGFNSILDYCITNGTYFGGAIISETGVYYSL